MYPQIRVLMCAYAHPHTHTHKHTPVYKINMLTA